jgi:hypothetical protein
MLKTEFFLASEWALAFRWWAAKAEKKSPCAAALISTAKLTSRATVETTHGQITEILRRKPETVYYADSSFSYIYRKCHSTKQNGLPICVAPHRPDMER